MTTPTLQYTAYRVITQAYRDCGLVQDVALPSGDQIGRAMMALNDMINLWVTQGLKLWITEDVPVPLVAGQAAYVLGPTGDVVMPRPLQVVECYYADSFGVRRPLIPLAWDDWVRLSQVNQQGQVNSYFEDKQQTYTRVTFWLTPDAVAATGQAHLILREAVNGPIALTDNIGFPVEWYIALRWGLAAELATGQPERIVARCETKAAQYRQALEAWDVENAPTQFVPDSRLGYFGIDWQ